MIDAPAPFFAELVSIVRRHFPWTAGVDVGPQTRLRDDLDLDSMHLTELQTEIESELGIEFDPLDDDFLDAFEDLGALARYAARLAGRAA